MRFLLPAAGTLIVLFLFVPVLAIVPMSFNDSLLFEIIPSNPSLTQYRQFFASAEWTQSLLLSLQIAAIVMVCTTILGVFASWVVAGAGPRLRVVAEALFLAPQIVPTVVLAAASYFLFVQLGIASGILPIVIMHTVVALPFSVILISNRLRSLPPDLGQASASLGAGRFRTFFQVILPHMALAIVGSGLFAFHVSFDEVILSLFFSGLSNQTLPVRLWNSIFFEVSPILPAVSTLLLVIPAIILAPLALFRLPR